MYNTGTIQRGSFPVNYICVDKATYHLMHGDGRGFIIFEQVYNTVLRAHPFRNKRRLWHKDVMWMYDLSGAMQLYKPNYDDSEVTLMWVYYV
jgi:hypothetical protein